MIIDTHAHTYLNQFDDDIDSVVQRAKDHRIDAIMLPNIDSSTVQDMHNLVDRHNDIFYPMIGLHPCSVKDNYKEELEIAKSYLQENKYWGIGETGIDLHWDITFKSDQIRAFETQIEWALEYNLPIIIHSRKSLDLTIDIISNNQNGALKGIFHCYNGTIEQSRKIMDANFMVGFGGVVTYKNANLEDTINYITDEFLLLETDSPYLSPVPFRGKRNESSFIVKVADKIAQVKQYTTEKVCALTTTNAKKLFNI